MNKETFRKIFFPLPKDMQTQGFQPNFYIKFLRYISLFLIKLLRLNGKNRFSNEFIQMLNPTIKVYISNQKDNYIIFRTGHGRLIWRAKTLLTEEPLTIKWINGFKKSDIFMDIGANVGNYSLYAAKKGIKTFSVEAEIINLSLLYENIFLNNLEHLITPVPFALYYKKGIETFFLKDISKGDALHSVGKESYIRENFSTGRKISILTTTLDNLISDFNIPCPTKLKIDVDGNERDIIKGAQNTLKKVDEICLELDDNLEEHSEIFFNLKELGFEIVDKENLGIQFKKSLHNNIFKRSKSVNN